MAHAPFLVGTAGERRCTGGHSHAPLVGRAADGSWRSSPAKEYPAQLCAWLARGLHDAAAERLRSAPRASLPELLDGLESLGMEHLYVPLDPYDPSHVAGAWAADTAAAAPHPPA